MREESGKSKRPRNITGITPAHAGRITPVTSAYTGYGDHPRACGKNLTSKIFFILYLGSPPRMREEYKASRSPCVGDRITPAHAGRIYHGINTLFTIRDHPRACGKNVCVIPPCGMSPGSPPRMREESLNTLTLRLTDGITPAHAGRMPFYMCIILLYKDHPRACGKNCNHAG